MIFDFNSSYFKDSRNLFVDAIITLLNCIKNDFIFWLCVSFKAHIGVFDESEFSALNAL
ncbi:hypothetical protein GCM10023262_04090 [Bartonella pachyuromydis]|uniref:Uncharacterized protein n=1 Tax=Bartonella pachyuromydis TaxID=931097 RepID=A0ABP8VD25_9HYPH